MRDIKEREREKELVFYDQMFLCLAWLTRHDETTYPDWTTTRPTGPSSSRQRGKFRQHCLTTVNNNISCILTTLLYQLNRVAQNNNIVCIEGRNKPSPSSALNSPITQDHVVSRANNTMASCAQRGLTNSVYIVHGGELNRPHHHRHAIFMPRILQ